VTLPLLLGTGLILNAAAALVVLWRGSLDPGGAAAGVVVGTVIFVCGGLPFWVVLMAFFVSSTALGFVGRKEKAALQKIHQKGGRRDMAQVLANGGVGCACAFVYKLSGNPAWALGFVVSFASSNADTWASELGVLSRRAPVSLLTLRSVTPGVSGGVSLLGSAMAFAGAVFIALLFAVENLSLEIFADRFLRVGVVIAVGGFVGSLVDSFLGATVQAQYQGAASLTELKTAEDGRANRLVRGFPFINNDVVNLASCAMTTALAVLLAPAIL
jgi:uncharacterized protein (TIGR00297 family)